MQGPSSGPARVYCFEKISTFEEEEKPATTWQQAFLKFGYGYHMAREKLLAQAFHWETMYEYETNVAKSWPTDKPVEDFKRAWIGEFIANSLHRPRSDTQRLLSMTLATGKPKKKGDDKVIFAAHAAGKALRGE